jgi:hypothetical protein
LTSELNGTVRRVCRARQRILNVGALRLVEYRA